MKRTLQLFLLMLSLFVHGLVVADEISVTHDDLQLKADLVLPDASTCHRCPLLVVIHGSGTSARENPWTSAWTNALVDEGVAVIHPDKRGSGESAGDWRKASIEDLAGDVSAFIEHAASHPRIDRARIGVIGFSQGGHVAPVVAAGNDKVRYVVSVSSSVVPMAEQMLDEVVLGARRDALPPSVLGQVRTLHATAIDYARDLGDYAPVAEARQHAAKAGAPDDYLGIPAEDDHATWRSLNLIVGFDPMPYWRQVTVPTAFIYGRQDDNVDIDKSPAMISRNLMKDRKPVSLVVFNENGHALFRKEAIQLVAAFAKSAGDNE